MNKKQLVKMFNLRYHNLEGMKKYEGIDSKLIKGYFDKLLPKYYGLVGQIIIKRNVLFGASRRNGSCSHITTGTKDNGSYLTICKVHLDENGHSTLFHELGHAMDIFPMESENSYSLIELNKTESLASVLYREFEPKANNLLELILTEYSKEVDNEFGTNTFSSYLANYKVISEYKSVEHKLGGLYCIILESYKNNTNSDVNKARYDVLNKEVCTKDMYTLAESVEHSRANTYMNNKYEVILDLLSSKYDLYKLYKLIGHSPKYYKGRNSLLAQEFFANMFELTVIGKFDVLKVVEELLPESYKAFNKLFTSLVKVFNPKHRISK